MNPKPLAVRALILLAFCTLWLAVRQVAASPSSITPPVACAASKPSGFVIRLPWSPGITHRIIQGYGTGYHTGACNTSSSNDYYALDFDLGANESVRAVAAGTVGFAGWTTGGWSSYGQAVYIDHGNGYESFYAHLNSVSVSVGQWVNQGDHIGGAGSTGGSWPVHLHFALYKNSHVAGGPYGGQATVPEPFSGVQEYENLVAGMSLTSSSSAQTHLECRNNQCVTVDGAGSDQCSSDLDCAPSPVDAAEHLAQSEYPTVQTGQQFSIWFEVRNTGNTTWRDSDGYGLENLNGVTLGAWGRQEIGADVPPGATKRWDIQMTAPATPGFYHTDWQLKHWGEVFGPYMFIDVTVLAPLYAPSNLTATPVSQSEVNLSWHSASTDVSRFFIARSMTGSDPWTLIDWVDGNVRSYQDSGLGCGKTFYYKVMAHRNVDDQYSDYSNVAPGTTLACDDLGPVVYHAHEIDDDNADESSGNADGVVNCGEVIELWVGLYNQGTDGATGVFATIGTDDPYVDWRDNISSSYPDIFGGETGTNTNDFDFLVDPDTPDGHIIQFDLEIQASNGGPWSDSFGVPVVCPHCSAPTLISPDDGYVHTSLDRTIAFNWSPPPDCSPDGYTFRVKTVSDMDSEGTTIFDEGQGGTQVTKQFGAEWDNMDLYWSVRACRPCTPFNPGPWAPSRRFRTEPGPEPQPDLVVTDISWSPPSPREGDSMEFTVDIMNEGNASTSAWGSFDVQCYMDSSSTPFDGEVVSSLGAGASTSVSCNWTAEMGSHTVTAVVDDGGFIPESNEGNNDRGEAFEVAGPCSDAYEPDDTSGQANWINDGSPQTHSICPVGDEDWVKFELSAESEVVIETSGPSGDTRMWLYDSGPNEIEYDDDGGSGLFSRIDRVCGVDSLPAGTYYVEVDEYFDDDEIPSYDIDFTVVQACGPGPQPDLVYYSYRIDDDNSGESSGNGDGIANCEETIELYVTLRNQGGDTATAVNATIRTTDPYITWLYNTSSGYPNIAGGSTGENTGDFDFALDLYAPDEHLLHFELDIIASNGGPWSDSFDVPVACPAGVPLDRLTFVPLVMNRY